MLPLDSQHHLAARMISDSPNANPTDVLATNLALWAEDISTRIADGVRGGVAAPNAAKVSQPELLAYYTHQLFNPDGTPNFAGRIQEMQRIGAVRFAEALDEVLKAHPEWKQSGRVVLPHEQGQTVPTDVPGVKEIMPPSRPTGVPGVSEVISPTVTPEQLPREPRPASTPGAY
jgi:hypothetical protein